MQHSAGDSDKAGAVKVAGDLADLGFNVVATKGTTASIAAADIAARLVNKVRDCRPHIADMLGADRIAAMRDAVAPGIVPVERVGLPFGLALNPWQHPGC